MELLRWFAVLIYVAAMFIFAGDEISSSTFTGKLLAKWLPHAGSAQIRGYVMLVRKAGHFFAYGLLAFLVYRAAMKTKRLQRLALPVAAVFAILVAIGDESYQRFLAHRTGAWMDVLIDGAGIMLTVISIRLHTKYRRRLDWEVREDVKDELI